ALRNYLPYLLSAYGPLAAHDPSRLNRLLVASDRAEWLLRTGLPHTVLRHLAVLPVDELAPLARRLRPNDDKLAALLRALPPARRGQLYDLALADVDPATYRPDRAVMEALPTAGRIREATRMLSRPVTCGGESPSRRGSAPCGGASWPGPTPPRRWNPRCGRMT